MCVKILEELLQALEQGTWILDLLLIQASNAAMHESLFLSDLQHLYWLTIVM